MADERELVMNLNPGSDEAVAQSCRCARSDNGYGRGFPWPRDDSLDSEKFPSFWISADCPLHGLTAEEDEHE